MLYLLLQVGLQHLVLGRRSNPDANNKDVICLGTFATASAWARSQFKSGDGTFKMTVKSFYQVCPHSQKTIQWPTLIWWILIQTFILLALLGGVYVPCIIALLPDKKRESYDVLFSLIWDYLNQHNLPNEFSSDYFMTDFEVSTSSISGSVSNDIDLGERILSPNPIYRSV